MNNSYDRAVKVLSVLIVPAVLAVACLAWSASRPPEAPLSGVPAELPAPPAFEREPVVEVGPAVLTVHEAPASAAVKAKPVHSWTKKPRTCGWYPMYASGDEKVWICS